MSRKLVTDKEVGRQRTDDGEQCPSVTLSIGDTYNSMGPRTESCATPDVRAVKEECTYRWQCTMSGWMQATLASRELIHLRRTHRQHECTGRSDRSSRTLGDIKCQHNWTLSIASSTFCVIRYPQQGSLCRVLCSVDWLELVETSRWHHIRLKTINCQPP